jgi:hypothetical protein
MARALNGYMHAVDYSKRTRERAAAAAAAAAVIKKNGGYVLESQRIQLRLHQRDLRLHQRDLLQNKLLPLLQLCQLSLYGGSNGIHSICRLHDIGGKGLRRDEQICGH